MSSFKFFIYALFFVLFTVTSCKSKKKTIKIDEQTQSEDTLLNKCRLPFKTAQGIKHIYKDALLNKCRLPFKTAKNLTKNIKENELDYKWISAKADVETLIDNDDQNLDIKVRGRKDSAIWISIQAIGLVDVAKILITRDTVKMVVYIKKQYFVGDFNYINQLLNADLDFDLIQAALFGNSAEFYDDDDKLKPVTDRTICKYLLSTERKKKLKRITTGQDSLKRSMQTMTINPDNYKILNNKFIDVVTNRLFSASYDRFLKIDSVYTPHFVNIDIKAEKKINVKINYVRIEINQPQKMPLNIPKSYESIRFKKEK